MDTSARKTKYQKKWNLLYMQCSYKTVLYIQPCAVCRTSQVNTFVKSPACQCFKLSKTVKKVTVIFFWMGSHVIQFSGIPLPYPEGEDLHSKFTQGCCNGSWVPTVGISISNEKYHLCGIATRMPQYLLEEKMKWHTSAKR